MTVKPIVALLALSLAGCHAHRASYVYQGRASEVSNGSGFNASVSVAGDSRVLAGIIVAVMVADGMRYYLQRPDGTMSPLERHPAPDPSRKVSEQDCSRPIALDGGNLRCR